MVQLVFLFNHESFDGSSRLFAKISGARVASFISKGFYVRFPTWYGDHFQGWRCMSYLVTARLLVLVVFGLDFHQSLSPHFQQVVDAIFQARAMTQKYRSQDFLGRFRQWLFGCLMLMVNWKGQILFGHFANWFAQTMLVKKYKWETIYNGKVRDFRRDFTLFTCFVFDVLFIPFHDGLARLQKTKDDRSRSRSRSRQRKKRSRERHK